MKTEWEITKGNKHGAKAIDFKWITFWNRITYNVEKNMSEIKDILPTREFSPFFNGVKYPERVFFFEFWDIKYLQKNRTVKIIGSEC